MKRQAGFTLIEALMAGGISLLIPAVLITIMNASNRQIGAGASQMRLSQIATSVSETIHLASLQATMSFDYADAVGAKCPDAIPPWSNDLSGFIFCDADKNIIAGFKVVEGDQVRGILKEYIPGGNPIWRPVVFSGDTVKIDYNPSVRGFTQKPGDLFAIRDGGFVWFNFRFDMEVGGHRLTLPLQTQSVVCRNAPSRLVTTGW